MAHGDSVVMEITRQISKYAREDEPLDPPLYDVIDVDALEQLFQSTGTGTATTGIVTFRYRDYMVSVDSAGRVDVVPQESDHPPARRLAKS